jgi:phospholipid/cholesterol/gamma-HCH transport system substrate-binding protein
VRESDSRIGVLAFLGATALVLVALVAFARYPSLFRRGNEYRAVFKSVPGLNLGDEVRYGGLLVGSITDLQLDPSDPTRILVGFRVKKYTPIRADTRASITQVGLLGQPFLNLTPGRRDAPPLPPGSTVPSYDNLTFQDAMSRLAQFLDRADTLLGGVERAAATSPWERVNRTISRVDTLVGAANVSSVRIFARLDTTTERLTGLLHRTERLIATLDTTVRSVRPELASTQQEALQTLRDMRVLVTELRDATDRGERLDVIVKNLSLATDHMARLTERLEQDPTSILRRRRAPAKPAGPQPRE